MNLFDFLLVKRLVVRVDSLVSGEVRIFKVLGRPSLVVGGLEQSGAFIGGIWKKALKKTPKLQNSKTQNVLILGLGGGTVAKLVNQFWPEAKMVGVEIDPVIIKLGKKYFGLDKIPNLKIINADAIKAINNQQLTINNFNLILVDVYLGDQVPKPCETDEFLQRVKKLLNPNGLIIFNRLFYKEKKKETEEFIKKLGRIFSKISLTRTPSNLLIFASI